MALGTPTRALAAEAGIELAGTLGVGWNSDHSLLASARPVPPPHARTVDIDDTGAGMLLVSVEGWVEPMEELTLGLEQELEYQQFFDGASLVLPRTDLWIGLRPHRLFALTAGASYRYYRYSMQLEDRFHEPGGWVMVSLHPRLQDVSLVYEVGHRLITGGRDDSETEHDVWLLWRVSLLDGLLTFGAGAGGAFIRGTEDWMHLDAVQGRLQAVVDYRRLDAGVRWTIGGMWFEDGEGLVNAVEGWVGATWVDWIRTGLEYEYETLDAVENLPMGAAYDHHVLLFTLTFSWEWTTASAAFASDPEPGEEGISVHGREVTFTVAAPRASTVEVTGSFDGWQDPVPLEGPDAEGMWTVTLRVEPGLHEVVYLIDGWTVTPPGAPVTVEDGFGGRNALVVVE
jgi:hypothetical protein